MKCPSGPGTDTRTQRETRVISKNRIQVQGTGGCLLYLLIKFAALRYSFYIKNPFNDT